MSITQVEKVRQYYESTAIDYKTVWTGPKDLAMHFGYYADGINKHEDALLKMNEVLSGLIRLTKDDRVMDAGCGYGGSAIWLAKNIGCDAVGFNVVPYQVKEARMYAEKYNLSKKVKFSPEDYSHTSFPDDSFTAVWGLESIVHAESKERFIQEAYRLLKSGGRILISEYMLRDEPRLSEDEKKIIEPWLEGWAMPHLLSPGEYFENLRKAGFKNLKVYILTPHVRRSINRLERLCNLSFPFAEFLHKIKLFSSVHLGNGYATIAQMKSLKMGLWDYVVVTGEKP